MHALHQDRFAADIHQSLEAVYLCAPGGQQPFQPGIEFRPVYGLVPGQEEGIEAVIVCIAACMGMRVPRRAPLQPGEHGY